VKPLDPRLLRHARAARRWIALSVVLGALTAGLVIAQALLLARVLAPAVAGTATVRDVRTPLVALAAVMLARVAVTWLNERWAHRAAGAVIAELRARVVDHATALGPRWLAGGAGAPLTTLVTRGLDALEPYFVRYLPQLVLAATVTPAVLAVVLGLDWIAAVTIAVTLPLVPIFMVLVGRLTQDASRRRLASMERLGAQMLDLVAGLPTLRAFGRERGPIARVRELGESHRVATMTTLRIAFLSGMVLELITTLSVALVAVGIGLRLVSGDLDLQTGLAVLVLAPEVYLPLRQVGAHFHASTDGIAAAARAFDVLDAPLPPRGVRDAPDLRRATIRLDGVSVVAPGRGVSAPAGLTLELRPGRVVALAGPSGAGKSTTAQLVLGLLPPDAGTVTIQLPGDAPVDLAEIAPESWWDQVSWVPQRPVILPGTLAENVAAGVDRALLDAAAALTGLDEVIAGLSEGWETHVGHGGVGLSVGQRQRLALTRALVADTALVVLDEPSAHLDAQSEQRVLDAVESLRAGGRTVLVVAHRRTLLSLADEIVQVHAEAHAEESS
jgi:ATP-binding cassette subfamily C protein CydD